MNESKLLADLEVGPSGRITAVFATLGVIDSDGDVIAPGAIPAGLAVPISAYGHSSWTGALPVGRGVIAEEGNRAFFRGRFFLDTVAGRETFTTLVGLAELQEWSFGYVPLAWHPERVAGELVRVLDRLDIFEVSPVLVGAGVGTRTVEIAERRDQLELAWIEQGVRRGLAGVNNRPDPATLAAYRMTGAVRRRSREYAGLRRLDVDLEVLRARALGVPVR